MILLRSILSLYEEFFKNEFTELIINDFNEKEQLARKIILDNILLDDTLLKAKLASKIYNSKPNNPSFRSFVSSFEKKVILIASMAKSKGSQIQQIRFSIQKDYTAFQNLLMLGIKDPGIMLGKKLYKKAIYYHDYKTALNVVEIIFQYFVSFGTKMEALQFDQLYRDIDKIYKAEHKSRLMFSMVLHAIKKKKIIDLKDENFVKWMEFTEKSLHSNSSDFHFFFYQIKLKLSKGQEYKYWCEEAIKYFKNLYFSHDAFLSVFRRRLLHFNLENGDLSITTLKLLKEIINKEIQYSNSWYIYVHTLVKTLMYLNDFNEASKWINKVLKSKKYRFIPKDHRNEWELINMYYCLMTDNHLKINIRKIKYNLNYGQTKNSSDNIPFLIGELMYLLKTGENKIDRKINHLRNTIKDQCKGLELERGLGFCDAVQKGQKFVAKKSEKSFENEYVFYEKLLEKV
jgi:hypothetical protein